MGKEDELKEAKEKLKSDPKFSIFNEVIKDTVNEVLEEREKQKKPKSILDGIFGGD